MAPCEKHFLLFPFLFLSLSLSFTNANAGRYFFSKMTRAEKSSDTTARQSSIPQEKNNSTNFSSNRESSGYGLYGRGPEQFVPTTTTTTTTTATIDNAGSSVADEELFNRNVNEEYKNRVDNTNDDPYKFSNKFTEERYRLNYDQKNRRNQYGMSDTRFMENGRYYYDVNARRYGYGFETDPVTTNADEYRSYGSYGGGDRTVGRYGNVGYGNGNGNGYKRYGNENERSQEEYIP